MADRWRFVDSIASSPTVRLDLNDLTIWETIDADLTPPELNRQSLGSALVDGEYIPASWYGNRTVRLSLDLLRSSTDLAATQRQALERELARECNFLEYRPNGATSSVFFRTKRSSGSLMQREVASSVAAYWSFDVPILAEPFAYGLKETPGNVTLAANPASANGLEFTITAANAKGDVETPLNLKFADASKFSPSSQSGIQTLIGTRRRGTVASMPYIFQCEAMTAGTDTALGANSALYSGAGNNNMLTTFVTTTLATRLTATVPASATVDARGQYRVFVKLRATGAYTGKIQWNYQGAGSSVSPAEGLTTYSTGGATTNAVFVDLGILSLPAAQDPGYDGPSGTALNVATGSLFLQAQRDSGAGNLTWDFIALVPADDTMCFVDWNEVFASATENGYIDGYGRRAFVGTDTEVRNYPIIGAPTGYPMITPNQDNRICVLPTVDQIGLYTLGTTHTVTPYYWPRYLDVRPATT